jgi:anti-sigma B factor antagonist
MASASHAHPGRRAVLGGAVTTYADFAIHSEERPASTRVIEVSGDIDLYTAPELRTALRAALDAAPGRLIVNLSAVSFIDSTGLAVVFSAWRRATGQQTSLVLVIDSVGVRRPFEISGMVDLLPIVASHDMALAVPASRPQLSET